MKADDCLCYSCRQRNGLNKNVRCALCRQLSRNDEICLVHAGRSNTSSNICVNKANVACKSSISNNNGSVQLENAANAIVVDEDYNSKSSIVDNDDNEFDDIKIEGKSNSTKVEGVVKCLIKIIRDNSNAKCLVFSYWNTMLDLIQESLKENFIEYRYLQMNSSVQKNLFEFKHNDNINVLLIPYNFGANGLNLIEAQHVLLVEPILNLSQEIQAIGRVHRIGQTKKTFVHRFLVRNTIEQLIYKLFAAGNSNYQTIAAAVNTTSENNNNDKHALSIADIRDLFFKL